MKLIMKQPFTDHIDNFLRLTIEEQREFVYNELKQQMSTYGSIYPRTSIKQLAKQFGSPERYKQVCKYEEIYIEHFEQFTQDAYLNK